MIEYWWETSFRVPRFYPNMERGKGKEIKIQCEEEEKKLEGRDQE